MDYSKVKDYDYKTLFKNKHYSYFDKGIYNLNIIGIRSKGSGCTNKYDDFMIVIYNDEKQQEQRKVFNITTDPGIYYLHKPESSKGTAILVPGQYRSCWEIGKHKNKYNALVQVKPVKVYRDNNKDDIYDLDPSTIKEGCFGINIHRSAMYGTTTFINNYSAGCQVFQNAAQFELFMKLCNKQKSIYGNSFTYTLIEEKDLV